MPSGLLRSVPVTDQERERNDRDRGGVVVLVVAVLCVYLYLFTHAADWVGLPRPGTVASAIGVASGHVFSGDATATSSLQVVPAGILSPRDALMVLFFIVAAAFLLAYYLPLRFKQPAMVMCAALGIFQLFGPRVISALLASHLVVYLVLHPSKQRNLLPSALAGLAIHLAFFHQGGASLAMLVLAAGVTTLTVAVYRYGVLRLLELASVARVLRTVVVQSAILTVCTSALIEGWTGATWSLPLGILLFFWQWERLMMYHIDYKDGLVPKELAVWRYLAVFWNPGVLPNWNWGVTIGQGYAYLDNGFLCEDKNKLVLSGVKLWGIALGYLLLSQWAVDHLVAFFEARGIPVFEAYTRSMVEEFAAGREVGTASVLVTTLTDLFRWITLWAGIMHFKVGVWRVCGYRVDAYIQRPWAATNLTTLWPRLTYHYREFLVRAFYYPVFFRFFKGRRTVRVVAATLAAASFGNLVWGHVPEALYYRGMELDNMLLMLRTWPYFLLLGLGISVSEIYLLRRRRTRKPWTLDRRIPLDLLATYCTLQYYALIHVFARPNAQTQLWDHVRLFVRGLGIHL